MWEIDEDDEDQVDCPICLDPMHQSDSQHPLQCTTKQCDFNFCHSCIESLITSSKDDYVEASDGNKHVKVWLHCPNCRSDLSPSIRETLLLRKADFLINSTHLSDEELSASQLRMKHVLNDVQVQKAIETARTREVEFFTKKYDKPANEIHALDSMREGPPQKIPLRRDSSDSWGVEVDLSVGVHKSFRTPKALREKKKRTKIDKTLFGGLDFSMSEAEQLYVTELMTSGDIGKLANAAAILHGVLNMNRTSTQSKPRMQKRSSVFQLIEEAEQAHDTAVHGKTRGPHPALLATKRETPAQIQAKMRRHMEYMKTHPLPVRMPKHVELSVPEDERGFCLQFCDDTWDGTVMDAFSKLTIGRGNKVYKKKSNNQGVVNVLSEGHADSNFGDAKIDVPCGRVLVSSVRGEGGRMGVLRGDVVTHVNGEPFTGKAANLIELIISFSRETHGETFTLVLNAERATAEALRRRALIEDPFLLQYY